MKKTPLPLPPPLRRELQIAKIGLAVTVVCAIFLWTLTKGVYARWPGVPPVPSLNGAYAMGLGDSQFAYRAGALMLQNMGDSGARVTPLKEYDFSTIRDWLFLMDKLDSRAQVVPLMAAYYFGAVQDDEQIPYILDYLELVGGRDVRDERWRWLAHAVYLARFKMQDLPRALELSYKLKAMHDANPGVMPTWTAQMPAFVLVAMNDKQAAKILIESIMMSGQTLNRNEMNFMRSYIRERLDDAPPSTP